MNNRLSTPEESKAKMQAMTMMTHLGDKFKGVTINGIKITKVNGQLKTDWQIEQHERELEAKEAARREKLIKEIVGGIGGFDFDFIEIEDITLENRNGELVVVDTK